MVGTIPVLGPMVQWSGVAEWAGLMGVLTRYRVALPDALQLAADGVANAAVGQLSRRMAGKAAEGQSVAQMVAESGQLPNSLIPLVRWGEQTGTLSEAFDTGRELLLRRVQIRAMLLKSILPPVLLIGIGCVVIFVVIGIFMPLVSMISGLS
jgi:type II secretory pathway component PulF